MSGPAVVIGFILLIPSILGMLFSGFLFFKSMTLNEPGEVSTMSAFEANFRHGCFDSLTRQPTTGTTVPYVLAQQCECQLSELKQAQQNNPNETFGQAVGDALTSCKARSDRDQLLWVSKPLLAFYTGSVAQEDDTATKWLRMFGGGFAIGLGISSFVGGLLGWLLVMKKRVLQCSVCGAVVNAS